MFMVPFHAAALTNCKRREPIHIMSATDAEIDHPTGGDLTGMTTEEIGIE